MKFITFVMAMMLLAMIPMSAFGQEAIPYIEILEPKDGSVVGISPKLVLGAKGYDLKSPSVSISEVGSNMGIGFLLDGCVFAIDTETGITEMSCSKELNLKSYAGKDIVLTASVEEQGKVIMDKVGLSVSEVCVQGP